VVTLTQATRQQQYEIHTPFRVSLLSTATFDSRGVFCGGGLALAAFSTSVNHWGTDDAGSFTRWPICNDSKLSHATALNTTP
jgi:hypothetical protein